MKKFKQYYLTRGTTLILIIANSHAQGQWNLTGGNNITLSTQYLGTNGSSTSPLQIKTIETGGSALPINFFTNNLQRVTILSGGNFGIGTATPTNLLQVSGGDVDVATSAKGYKLMGKTVLFNNGITQNIFVGFEAGLNTYGDENFFGGYRSGYSNVYGNGNVYIGSRSGYFNTDGDYNVAVGGNSIYANTTGNGITAIGFSSGRDASGNYGVYVGYYAGLLNTTAANNVFVGAFSGQENSTGGENTHIGYTSGRYNATGSFNTTLGFEAGKGILANNYSYNTFIGNHSGQVNTTGEKNVFIGMNSGYSNSTGRFNTFSGYNSGVGNTSGESNVYYGYQSGYNGTTGYSKTFIGTFAGYTTTTGSYSTAIGTSALYGNTTGLYQTALGYNAGYTNTTGSSNTFVGNAADANAGTYSNATAIGNGSTVNASNKVRIGNTNVTVIEGQVAFTTSDGRFKFNVNENVKGLDFIKLLRPVSYQFNTQEFENFLSNGRNTPTDSSDLSSATQSNFDVSMSIVRTGFIAQEVEQAATETGFITDIVHAPVDEKDNYSIQYGVIVVPLVKAVQEQQDSIADLKYKIADLKNNLQVLNQNQSITQQNYRDTILNLINRIAHIETVTRQCCAAAPQRRLEDNKAGNGPAYTSSATEKPLLLQNSPNPFSQNTYITYYLPENTRNAQLKIYTIQGEELRVFQLSGTGYGKVQLSGGSLAAGNYTYSLLIDGVNLQTKNMVLTK